MSSYLALLKNLEAAGNFSNGESPKQYDDIYKYN